MDHLIGSNVLKAYMHGFFVDFRLYEKAKAIANPFAYEEYRKKQLEDKLAAQARSRITSNLPKVNKKLAKQALKSNNDKQKNLLEDPRFKEMFSNPDFEIVEESAEWKLAHPSGSKNKRELESDVEEEEQQAEESDEYSDFDSDS